MSLKSQLLLFFSKCRRRLKKLISTESNKSKMGAIDSIIWTTGGTPSKIDYFYYELIYRHERTPSYLTNHIFQKFQCRHDLDDFIQTYDRQFVLIRIKRGVVLK